MGNNSAGMTGKLESLKRAIEVFNPGVIMLQETKLKRQGLIKLKDFVVFEKLRENTEGGGLMSVIHENLKPILISDDHSEFLVVDVTGNFGSIRLINCYGPQENLPLEVRTEFFIELESRIFSAKTNGKLICIQCDANSKLGNGLIKGDPQMMSANGKIMSDMLARQNLIVVNASDKCYGVITRFRKTARRTEESVLDYFIVCQELYQNIVKMVIDEQRQYVLSRFYKYKHKTSTVESDHNIMVLYLNFKWNQKICVERKEIYNLRNSQCQQVFQENTSKNPKLVQILKNQDIARAGAKWIKEIKHEISNSFKKIRISGKKENLDENVRNLFSEREKLKYKIADSTLTESVLSQSKSKLKDVEARIADINAEKNFNTIKDHVKHLVDDTDNLNCIKMWQLKKKICSKKSDPPVAKLNEKGELVTEPTQLKKLYENTYKKRLEHRTMKPELEGMYNLKMELFNLRLEVTKNIKSDNWSEEDLIKVIKSLKKNKSSDSQGLIYELFRPEIIGTDLFSSLLLFCNSVKSQLSIPEFIMFTDITSIYKMKGKKSELDNDRGIFGVSKLLSIIENWFMKTNIKILMIA